MQSMLQVSFILEDDAASWGARDTERRAFFSACITLTLGVLGRSEQMGAGCKAVG